jgi:hypothetical protein
VSTPDPLLEAHFVTVVKALLSGRVVPLLGAGVNLTGRPEAEEWAYGKHLPSGRELAAYLAESFAYPSADLDLVRVSQYAAVMAGSGPLYDELHRLFDFDYPPTPLHGLLAGLPGLLRERGTPRYQMILTTNYDDALEKAFRDADEPFDLITYVAEGEQRGSFLHCPPDEHGRVIEVPNKYNGLPVDERGDPARTVILKIHGAVDRLRPEHDSFVITEDHYIEYLTRSDISSLLPASLVAKLKRSHFLFLGYSMRDWNLRVILHRIWGEQRLTWASWAVQLNPEPIEQQFWNLRGVQIYNVSLSDYVAELEHRISDGAGP